MKTRFTQARADAGLSQVELAQKMGVSNVTINNWETGRREPSLKKLKKLSMLLGVSADYLLGIDRNIYQTEHVAKAALPALHRTPVWTERHGWALVNAVKQQIVFTDGSNILFKSLNEPFYVTPPQFALSLRGVGKPLDIDATLSREQIWVEPVTEDSILASELRGWYRSRGRRLVENEYGNRFYLDTYGAKWLAFEDCLSEKGDIKNT